jgi:hypothetical protein
MKELLSLVLFTQHLTYEVSAGSLRILLELLILF